MRRCFFFIPSTLSCGTSRVVFYTTTRVGLLSSKTTFWPIAGERRGLEEEENEKEEEEEEFRLAEAAHEEAEFLPLVHRLAAKADALDTELQRLSYVLYEKPQLVVDTCAATLTGRPANIAAVIKKFYGGSANRGRPAKWTRPLGSSSLLIQWLSAVRLLLLRFCGCAVPGAVREDQLVTLTADLDHLRRMKKLHALNFYSRMNLTPKRHIWLAIYAVLWNCVVALQNSLGCVIFGALRGVRNHGLVVGLFKGTIAGLLSAFQFLAYGLLLSPLIHIPCGLCNSVYGAWNAVAGTFFFEASAGRWQRCSAVDSAWLLREMRLEERVIRAVGRVEFRRKNMKPEERWRQRLASMGFSVDRIGQKMTRGLKKRGCASSDCGGYESEGDCMDPYEVLRVKRSATQAQIRAQYKNLAKVFHPDVVQTHHGGPPSDEERINAQQKFEKISRAYQILSNPEKRKSYDLGGAQALRLHESKIGRFMSRTPEEMVQSVFGGEPFKQKIIGALLRSHWHLRNEAQVSVSLHEFEELQCLRCRKLSVELAQILDVHANMPTARSEQQRETHVQSEVLHNMMHELGGSVPKLRAPHLSARQVFSKEAKNSCFTLTSGSNEYNCFSRDFEERCDRFTRNLADACFGKELIYEVGQSYIVSSQRFLGIRPFYAPKLHVYKKIFSGTDRIYAAFREKIADDAKNNSEWFARKVMLEYFSMEFDAVVADMSVILRYAAQNVLQDVTLSETQRRRRCYALWYLGEQMVHRGVSWSAATARDDAELMAYIQQAANSASTTSKAKPF